jgi:mono/diheme cytochrome c family protein
MPLVVGVFLGFCTIAAAQESKTTRRTVWDGVYSAAEAERGKAAYGARCAMCHLADLTGYYGALKGDHFMEHWRESVLNDLFANISSTMPRDAPGTLSEGVYLDILAYVLSANGFPPGANELTRDTLGSIQVEGKAGPQEVPSGALVDVIGCLVESSNKGWTLAQASEPIRTRNPSDPTVEEAKAWDAKPLGTHTFGLLDAPSYLPESKKGRRVEAKGFIIRVPGDDRINLTSLRATDVKCGS